MSVFRFFICIFAVANLLRSHKHRGILAYEPDTVNENDKLSMDSM